MKAETVIKRILAITDLQDVVKNEITEIEKDIRLEKIRCGKLKSIKIELVTGGTENQDIIPMGKYLGVGLENGAWKLYHLPVACIIRNNITKAKAIKLAKTIIDWDIKNINVTTIEELRKIWTPEQLEYMQNFDG